MKDPYLLAKALAYAIVAIEARPERIREQADYHDMVLLFRKLPASERELFLEEARRDLINQCEPVEKFPVQAKRVETSPLTSREFPGGPLRSSAPSGCALSPALLNSTESD
jgi:hypothetical protein